MDDVQGPRHAARHHGHLRVEAATNATAELLGDEGLRGLADQLGEIINPEPAES